MATRIDKFEERFNSIELRDNFKRITNLDVIGNETAYMSFIGCLLSEVNFKAIEELYSQIKELKQK